MGNGPFSYFFRLQQRHITPDRLKFILETANHSIWLKALMLEGNDLGDEGCDVLSEYLANDGKLTYLFLEKNGISNKGLEILLEGLRNC